MSRNLCRTNCYYCRCEVIRTGETRELTDEDVGAYFPEYCGMIVAEAECSMCEAKYLAWMGKIPHSYRDDGEIRIRDLSFRSSFNDEPGVDDLPAFEIEERIAYVKTTWPTFKCGARKVHRDYDYCLKCRVDHKDESGGGS